MNTIDASERIEHAEAALNQAKDAAKQDIENCAPAPEVVSREDEPVVEKEVVEEPVDVPKEKTKEEKADDILPTYHHNKKTSFW
jgi:hypothetical protein